MLEFIRPTLSVPNLDWGQTTKSGGVSNFVSKPNDQSRIDGSQRISLAFQQHTLNLASHVNDAPEAVNENWLRFASASGWTRETVSTCNQVHGDLIFEATHGGHNNIEADAIISRKPGLAVGIYTADCVPMLIVDPESKHVAAIHCGWKGVALKLASKTIKELVGIEAASRSNLLVWIGASIRCESYEVGADVASKFNESVLHPGKPGKFQLDLPKAVRHELLNAGISNSNIEDCLLDTYTAKDRFFSYRAEGGKTGRMMTFVGFSQ